ncbi:hypothetical protein DTL42_13990 [Bremerella cremea]|uniref:Uncharacterized protein n=1 Tax=Bremerella cremea TaxID=1031537 RepID=A0A368KPS9_9BACT|nr:hypothetical protein [Bremerella cremea]RCS47631.1 hypothetical protein DTL42_13990 [Bremerella cremea]
MRGTSWFAAVVIVMCVGLFAIAQDGAKPDAAKTPPVSVQGKLDELLHQRRDTLAAAYEHTLQQYKSGVGSFHEVLSAEAELAGAELELASTVAARQRIHERRIKALVQQERNLEKQVRSGTIRELPLYQAKARRLQAEIEMLRDTED